MNLKRAVEIGKSVIAPFKRLEGPINALKSKSIRRGLGGGTFGIAGAILGGATGGPVGAAIGATAGGTLGSMGGKLAGMTAKVLINNPKKTFGLGLMATSAYSFSKPMLGNSLVDSKRNRSTNPAINMGMSSGPGFVQFGNQSRIRMDGNHMGASGDLTLSLRTLRHGRK
jgi:hypothetical protein